MSHNHHVGSCLCGAVRFEVTGSFDGFYLCHCQRCRKDTGSAHAANLFSSTARLQWQSGDVHVHRFDVPSTRHTKCFCVTCGSALPYHTSNGQLLVVPAGSLDSEVSVRPNAHIFVGSRAAWDSALDAIPGFEELPV